MPRWEYLAALTCGVLAVAACTGPGPLKVGEAMLAPILLGTDPVPEHAAKAPTVEVLPGTPTTLPNVPVVKLAVDRLVTWGKIKALRNSAHGKNQKLVFLVATRRRVRSFHFDDELTGPVIQVYARMAGKLCVKHPDVRKAKCNQGIDEKYIDPAFTRGLVREAINGYERTNAEVYLLDALPWGDVVAAIGGARSCCGDRDIRVRVRNAEDVEAVDFVVSPE